MANVTYGAEFGSPGELPPSSDVSLSLGSFKPACVTMLAWAMSCSVSVRSNVGMELDELKVLPRFIGVVSPATLSL